jgi:phospholipid/cholesterol/gamma-HCH transport system substrate-binding protein
MRTSVTGVVLRLAAFVVVCAVGTFGLVAVFGQFRFGNQKTYSAEFTSVSGLQEGNFVRVAGVEVGKVQSIAITARNTAIVQFSAEDSVPLTQGTKALVRFEDVYGGRYLALDEGAGSLQRLQPGQLIPLQRTAPALDFDALIGGFRPLFRALNPDQVNALTGQLISVLQGQGATINSFLAQTSQITSTLADRDQLIGDVITNLNVVLGSLGDKGDQFGKALGSLSDLVHALAARKSEISTGLAHTEEATRSVADLLEQIRPPFKDTVAQGDRSAGIVVADHDYFDNLLNTLPDSYRIVGRQGLYGDFFSFYLCDLLLKVNGKGGQPVFIKVAGQVTGRCAPK